VTTCVVPFARPTFFPDIAAFSETLLREGIDTMLAGDTRNRVDKAPQLAQIVARIGTSGACRSRLPIL
jgi:hypothetical protein